MRSDGIQWFRVRLELKRIQTWLFLVPKLKTILGANTLLGEFVRIHCPELAIGEKFNACAPENHAKSGAPGADHKDPLNGVSQVRDFDWHTDNPAASYAKGILTRDGGHFQALFREKTCATDFASELARKVALELPGIVFEIKVENWADGMDPPWQQIAMHSGAATTLLLPPSLPVCKLSGDGLATDTVRMPEIGDVRVSRRVKQQWDAGESFKARRTDRGEDNRRACDIVSLLGRAGKLPMTDLPVPNELKELAGDDGRYIALIHADGNNVGTRSSRARGEGKPDSIDAWLVAEAKGETFFHGMRVAVRKALVEALSETFKGNDFPSTKARPYQLLMLGGDDLLLMCRASHALRFSFQYAKALEAETNKLPDGDPLGVGVGVAICPPTFRFHAMHNLAEELAESAKRIARRPDAPPGESVIDWMVVSKFAAMGVAGHRRRFESLCYRDLEGGGKVQLALTAKPYPILARSGSDWSLERLLASADALGKKGKGSESIAARSQMKAFPANLRLGYHAGLFAARDLPEEICSLLAKDLTNEFPEAHKGAFPWRAFSSEDGIKRYRTLLVDLFEILEIRNLGRGRAGSPAKSTAKSAADESAVLRETGS